MTGTVQVSGQERELELSHTKEELLSSNVKMIYGYQESWSHNVGQEIIQESAEKDQIAFIFFDEGHQNMQKFWVVGGRR